jgi:tRNA(Ile)-lysidine synthase
VSSIRQSVRAAFRDRPRVVLAVSGGLDSMALLDAACASFAGEELLVATFDHGTGPAAQAAASLVEQTAAARGVRAFVGRADRSLSSEAQWREARWRFLRSTASDQCATIATAHTRDDQVETVLMRVLRGAGARGLAALYATSDVLRPLLGHSRQDLRQYARSRGLSWIEDPSNLSPRFFRNRVRHDLLPALRRSRPRIDDDLLAIARRAARWRASVEAFVEESVPVELRRPGMALDVPLSALESHAAESLAVLWPTVAAKVGITLDRRGIQRLVAFTHESRVGARMQLSGGWEAVRSRGAIQLRKRSAPSPGHQAIDRRSGVAWGPWSIRPSSTTTADAWTAWLPVDKPLTVRAWRSGDAMAAKRGSPPRKVKRFLSDAGVNGHERASWPVVTAGDEIIWIPGVRRSDAAERSGQPGLAFSCEYHYR